MTTDPRPTHSSLASDWWLDVALAELCGGSTRTRSGLAEAVAHASAERRERAAQRAFAPHARAFSWGVAAAVLLGVGALTLAFFAARGTPNAAASHQDPERPTAVLPENGTDLAAHLERAPFIDITPVVDDNGWATTPFALPRPPAALGLDAAALSGARKPFADRSGMLAWLGVRCRAGTIRARLYERPEPHLEFPTREGPIVLTGAPARAVQRAAVDIASGAPSHGSVIRVRTASEFIQAIGSDRTIVIPEGVELALHEASIEGENDEHVRFSDRADQDRTWEGFGYPAYAGGDPGTLTLTGLRNLRIVGEGRGAGLVTRDLSSRVLELRQCRGIALDNLSLGHAPQATCAGGVLGLDGCEGVRGRRLSLYGCGTEGILARDTHDVLLDECRIHHCATGIMALQECTRWKLLGMRIDNIKSYHPHGAIWISQCQHIHVERARLELVTVHQSPVLAHAEGSRDVRVQASVDRCGGYAMPAVGLLWIPVAVEVARFDALLQQGHADLAAGRFDAAARAYLQAAPLAAPENEHHREALRTAAQALEAAGAVDRAKALEAALDR